MLVGYEVKNIKDLNISLDNLYNGEKQINIHLTDKPYTFHVVLKGRPFYNSKENKFKDTIDCMISSYNANLTVRTNKGMRYEKYKNIGTLQTALKKLINNNVDTTSVISFSLNNEVYSF